VIALIVMTLLSTYYNKINQWFSGTLLRYALMFVQVCAIAVCVVS
jgi:hypothetical protein